MSPNTLKQDFLAIDKYGATHPEILEEPVAARMYEIRDRATAKKACHPWDSTFDASETGYWYPDGNESWDVHADRKEFNRHFYGENKKDEQHHRSRLNHMARKFRFPPVTKLSDTKEYLPPGTLERSEEEIVETAVNVFRQMREVFEEPDEMAYAPLTEEEAGWVKRNTNTREELRGEIVYLKRQVDYSRAIIEFLNWEAYRAAERSKRESRSWEIEDWIDDCNGIKREKRNGWW